MREENERRRIRTKYLWRRVRIYVTARRFVFAAKKISLKRNRTEQLGINEKSKMIEFTKRLKELSLDDKNSFKCIISYESNFYITWKIMGGFI